MIMKNQNHLKIDEEKEKYKIDSNERVIIKYKALDDQIRLFGDYFINNNKDNCKIIINGKENELISLYSPNKLEIKDKTLEIILIGINNITDASYMFESCSSIISISEWDTSNIINMSYMFSKCSALNYLPDISKWNTSKVKSMCFMFYECTYLINLPDISNWDISNNTEISFMFLNVHH